MKPKEKGTLSSQFYLNSSNVLRNQKLKKIQNQITLLKTQQAISGN